VRVFVGLSRHAGVLVSFIIDEGRGWTIAAGFTALADFLP
jgi:hypothetical protein